MSPFAMMRTAFAWFKVNSQEGIAAVEYGLLAALIAVTIITAVSLIGTNLSNVFKTLAANFQSAGTSGHSGDGKGNHDD
jgi:pilus assembly protein Flp/PilA